MPLSEHASAWELVRPAVSGTTRNRRDLEDLSSASDDVLDQRPKQLDSLEAVLPAWKRFVLERDLRLQRAEEFLGMDDVADAVYICVFLLRRTLPFGEVRQVRHELGDEAFEEGHHDHDPHPRESGHELADVLQVAIDR